MQNWTARGSYRVSTIPKQTQRQDKRIIKQLNQIELRVFEYKFIKLSVDLQTAAAARLAEGPWRELGSHVSSEQEHEHLYAELRRSV
jgi:hypothetical protein